MRTSYQSTHRPSGMLSQEFTSSFRLCKQSANSLTDIICFFWRSLAKLFCTARNDNSFWTSGPNSRWHSRGVLRLAASAFPLSRCARGTGCSASARATRSKLEWSCSDCVTSDVRQANTCATMHDKLYKSSLCDRLGAYCRTTWLLTLWQRKDKNLALTEWQSPTAIVWQPEDWLCDKRSTDCWAHWQADWPAATACHNVRMRGKLRGLTVWQSKGSLCDRLGAYCRATWLLTLWQGKDKNQQLNLWQSLQPLCDNLKTDCATREVQTAEHTEVFLRMNIYEWFGRYTNELGLDFFLKNIPMNLKTYEWIGVQFFWGGRYTNELEDIRMNWGLIFFGEGRYMNELAVIRMNWGSIFLERENIRMNWQTYEWIRVQIFLGQKIYEWIGRHTNELGLQADWPAATACHCVTMHDKLRAHCVTT